ncbi:hypothetical protein PROFUN_01820 [Planoprotostelium fungivorum]|uniref:DNA-directed RNA polymerase III subunit RPC4 n=1 Tax=Planoprotostelium fungivorum TaxID=1890364 RepID=A0A2P6NYR3_9EUKA|nr:hypothetical protein PROFUN_01820 [Planoprotostelium fungivorum]
MHTTAFSCCHLCVFHHISNHSHIGMEDQKPGTPVNNNNNAKPSTPGGGFPANAGRGSKVFRLNPEHTLGGVKKKTFTPSLPSTPYVRKADRPAEAGDAASPATPVVSFRDRQNRPSQIRGNELMTKAKEVKQPLFNRTPGSGPFGGASSYDADVKYDDDMDLGTSIFGVKKKKKEKKIVINEYDPSHPVKLPFGRTQEEGDKKNITKSMFRPNELSFIHLPSMLPVPIPKVTKEQKEEVKEKEKDQFVHTSTKVPEGMMGKIRVHKSGKVSMVVGEHTFQIIEGMDVSFLQHLAHCSPSTHEAHQVESVTHSLVCIPDIESFLSDNTS